MTKQTSQGEERGPQAGPPPSTDTVEWARASGSYRVAVWSARLAAIEVPSLVVAGTLLSHAGVLIEIAAATGFWLVVISVVGFRVAARMLQVTAEAPTAGPALLTHAYVHDLLHRKRPSLGLAEPSDEQVTKYEARIEEVRADAVYQQVVFATRRLTLLIPATAVIAVLNDNGLIHEPTLLSSISSSCFLPLFAAVVGGLVVRSRAGLGPPPGPGTGRPARSYLKTFVADLMGLYRP